MIAQNVKTAKIKMTTCICLNTAWLFFSAHFDDIKIKFYFLKTELLNGD